MIAEKRNEGVYQEERLVAILDFLKQHNRITTEQICTLLQVSRDTARRDLVKLEEQNAIIRTRGGAILPTVHQKIQSYSGRLKTVSEEKIRSAGLQHRLFMMETG